MASVQAMDRAAQLPYSPEAVEMAKYKAAMDAAGAAFQSPTSHPAADQWFQNNAPGTAPAAPAPKGSYESVRSRIPSNLQAQFDEALASGDEKALDRLARLSGTIPADEWQLFKQAALGGNQDNFAFRVPPRPKSTVIVGGGAGNVARRSSWSPY